MVGGRRPTAGINLVHKSSAQLKLGFFFCLICRRPKAENRRPQKTSRPVMAGTLMAALPQNCLTTRLMLWSDVQGVNVTSVTGKVTRR